MGVSNREEGAKEEKEMKQKNEVGWKNRRRRGPKWKCGRKGRREKSKNGKREKGEGEGFKKKKTCVNKVGIGFQKQSVKKKTWHGGVGELPTHTHTCTPHRYKSPPSSRKRQEGESSQTKKRGEREVTQGRGRP